MIDGLSWVSSTRYSVGIL